MFYFNFYGDFFVSMLTLGLNSAQLDTSTNSISAGSTASHANLLQPLSMQNLIAMACMGQSPISPNASSQSLSSAQLGTTTTPLCKFLQLIEVKFQLFIYDFFIGFRVSTRLCCKCIASIYQWLICSNYYNGQCFKYDCISSCWKAN